jgi:hypothetical protein
MAVPLVALAFGLALTARSRIVPTHGDPRVLESCLSLGMGVCVGSVFAVAQKRQLRRHRDFVALQCIAGHARGLAVELRWLRVLWPFIAGLSVAIVAAWWLAWPALVAMSGVMASAVLLYKQCSSIHTLAKRMVAPGTVGSE